MAMATAYDYTPLFRSSVGFDRVFNLLENAQRVRPISDWPPYDILKLGDDTYRISIAVAGFSEEDISLTFQSNLLTVSGAKQTEESDTFLHRGIAGRPFEHKFQLADHVKVTSASMENGLLSVDLVREIPEEMKPRRIAINGNGPSPAADRKRIESQHAA
jgi:molecular chaperone IbpA